MVHSHFSVMFSGVDNDAQQSKNGNQVCKFIYLCTHLSNCLQSLKSQILVFCKASNPLHHRGAPGHCATSITWETMCVWLSH